MRTCVCGRRTAASGVNWAPTHPHMPTPPTTVHPRHAASQGWNLELSLQDASGTLSFSFLFSFFSNVSARAPSAVVQTP